MMLGALHSEVRHLALDHSRIGAAASLGQQLEEQLRRELMLRVVEFEYLRGKNPGGMPRSGAPPAGCA
jgi:hypothetical protein